MSDLADAGNFGARPLTCPVMRLAALTLGCLAACTASAPPQLELDAYIPADDDPAPPLEPPPGAPEAVLATAAPASPPTPLQIVAGVDGSPFGGDRLARASWLARGARFVALTMSRDRAECRGSHTLHDLHDLHTGARERRVRIVDSDPRGRYLVFNVGAHLWLLDSDTGVRAELAARGAALYDDGDPCSVERRAAFDGAGRHLVYLRGPRSREQIVWRDLASGREVTVAAPPVARPIWRAEPSTDPAWIRVFSVPQDSNEDGRIRFPRLRERHHSFFTGSDEVVSHTLSVTGEQRPIVGPGGASDEGFAPLGHGLFAARFDRSPPLLAANGDPPALPLDCELHHALDGLPAVLLRCLGEQRVWWPHAQRSLDLSDGGLIDAPAQPDAEGQLWRAARVKLGPDATHIVRINGDTATAVVGPRLLLDVMAESDPSIASDRAGWLLLNSPAGLLTLDTATGRAHVHLGVLAPRLRRGAAQLHGRWYALDPARGRMHPLPHAPAAVAENGCALLGTDATGILGPWTLRCPRP